MTPSLSFSPPSKAILSPPLIFQNQSSFSPLFPSLLVDTSSYHTCMASLAANNVSPQNQSFHGYSFSPLPQSETELHDDGEEDQHLSAISLEPIRSTLRANLSEYYYSDEIYSVSARTWEMTQDFLGLTVLMILIFLPLYRRLGAPAEDPIPPVITLNSMYLSNFTTGVGDLAATWDAKFTLINTNVSSIYFRTIDFTIFYKQNPDDALSAASSYPFYLDQGEYVKLHLKFETKGLSQDNQPLVEEIGKDRAKYGSLSFGMQMKVQAVYYGETWVSDVVMTPHCEDLTIQFWPNKDSGRLTNLNRNFSVPVEWKSLSFF